MFTIILKGKISSRLRLKVCNFPSLKTCLLSSFFFVLQDAYPVGSVFHRLVCLKICTSEIEWFNLLMCVLKDSPSLKALKLEVYYVHFIPKYSVLFIIISVMIYNAVNLFRQQRSCWNEPSSVPACLLSSLETFEWVNYEGTEEEKEVVAFILRSGRCLKKVNISSETTTPTRNLSACTRLKP